MADLKNLLSMGIEELSTQSKKSVWSKSTFLAENRLCYTENGAIHFEIELSKIKVYAHRVANILDNVDGLTVVITPKPWKDKDGKDHISKIKSWKYDKNMQKDVDALCEKLNEMVLNQMEEYFTSDEYKNKKKSKKK